ncbi:hypothetical protein BC831DRAFT_302920 [Entophlyctis helioformis]|nr:hypothetical protein BC831DRAFT_302920 [Entophlyctis helioformis]
MTPTPSQPGRTQGQASAPAVSPAVPPAVSPAVSQTTADTDGDADGDQEMVQAHAEKDALLEAVPSVAEPAAKAAEAGLDGDDAHAMDMDPPLSGVFQRSVDDAGAAAEPADLCSDKQQQSQVLRVEPISQSSSWSSDGTECSSTTRPATAARSTPPVAETVVADTSDDVHDDRHPTHDDTAIVSVSAEHTDVAASQKASQSALMAGESVIEPVCLSASPIAKGINSQRLDANADADAGADADPDVSECVAGEARGTPRPSQTLAADLLLLQAVSDARMDSASNLLSAAMSACAAHDGISERGDGFASDHGSRFARSSAYPSSDAFSPHDYPPYEFQSQELLSQELLSSQDLHVEADLLRSPSPTATSTPPAPDAFLTGLRTMVDAAALASAEYRDLKMSWTKDRKLLESKLAAAEARFEQSQSLGASLQNQVSMLEADLSSHAAYTARLERDIERLGKSEAMQGRMAAGIKALFAEFKTIRQALASAKEQLGVLPQEILGQAAEAMDVIKTSGTAAFEKSEALCAQLAEMSRVSMEMRADLERAQEQVALLAAQRDDAHSQLGSLRCVLNVAHDRFIRHTSRLTGQLQAQNTDHADLESSMAAIQSALQEEQSKCQAAERRIEELGVALEQANRRALDAEEDGQARLKAQSMLSQSLSSTESHMVVLQASLNECQAELEQTRTERDAAADQARTMSDSWRSREAEYVFRVNQLSLEAKASSDKAEGLQSTLDNATEQLRLAMKDVNAARNDAHDWEAKCASMQDALSAMTAHKESEHASLQRVSTELEAAEARLAEANEKLAAQIDASAAADQVIAEINATMEQTRADMLRQEAAAAAEIAALCQAKVGLEQQHAAALSKVSLLETEREDLMAELKAHNSRIQELESAYTSNADQIQQHVQESEKLTAQVASLEAALAAAREQADASASTAADAACQIAKLDDAMALLTEQHAQLNAELEDVRAELANEQERGKTLAAQHAADQQRIADEHVAAIAAAQAAARACQDDLDMAQSEVIRLTNSNDELAKGLERTVADNAARISQLEAMLAAETDERNASLRALESLRESLAAAVSEQDLLKAARLEAQEMLEAALREKQSLEHLIETHRSRVAEMEQDAAEKDARLDVSTLELQSLRQQVSDAKDSALAAEARVQERDVLVQAADAESLKLRQQLATAESQRETLQALLDDKSKAIEDLAIAQDSAVRDRLAAKAKFDELAAVVSGLLTEKADVQERLARMESTLDESETRIKANNDKHMQEQAALKEIIASLREQNQEAVKSNASIKMENQVLSRKIDMYRSKELEQAMRTPAGPTSTAAASSAVNAAAANPDFGANADGEPPLSGSSVWDNRSNVPSQTTASQELRLQVLGQKRHGLQSARADQTPAKKRVRGDLVGGGQATSTPGSVRRSRQANAKILICFSGFKEGTPYNTALKKDLVAAIKKLPDATFLMGSTSNYDSRITHMIAPQGSRTLKTFAASLMSTWLIHDPNWILDSASKGVWLPETKYGFRNTVNPIQGKRFFLAPSFLECPKTKDFRQEYLKCLVLECSHGSFVEKADEADYVIRSDSDTTAFDGIPVLDWNAFIALIPHSSPAPQFASQQVLPPTASQAV